MIIEDTARRTPRTPQRPDTRRDVFGVIEAHAHADPERTACIFLRRDGRVQRMTYRALVSRCGRLAHRLRQQADAGERVLLLDGEPRRFVVGFLGAIAAGLVPVPAPAPVADHERRSRRLATLIEAASPTLALVDPASGAEALLDIPCEPIDDRPGASISRSVTPAPEDTAMIQFTSGSTTEPRGAVVTHGNLTHNARLIADAFHFGPEETFVSWLPLFHDMGLIYGALQPLFLGARTVLMEPAAFVERPARWLSAISRYRGTTTAAPDSAYARCVRRVSPELRDCLDLSSLRVAIDGAEPVCAETLDRFAEAFGPAGLRRSALRPAYGLAEATLVVSAETGSDGPVTLDVDRPSLERGEVRLGTGRTLVSCGEPAEPEGMVIVDPRSHRPCPSGKVGEIWIATPNVAAGYWNDRETTRETFEATLEGTRRRPHLRTGDLGFLHDGRLFVTGRLKDVIIVNGRNVHPTDLEEIAVRAHPTLRPGCACAFQVEARGRGGVVMCCEVRDVTAVDAACVTDRVTRYVAQESGIAPIDVALVAVGAIPKTTSGKIRRQSCRRDYLCGRLASRPLETPDEGRRSRPVGPTVDQIARWLACEVATEMSVDVEEIVDDAPLANFGLTSVSAASIVMDLSEWLGIELSATLVYEYPTIDALARHLQQRVAPPPERAALETSHQLDAAA